MNDAEYFGIILSDIVNTLGFGFLILCAFKKCYSWIVMLIAQSSWFIFNLYYAKVDYIALYLIALCGAALYFWRHTKYEYETKKIREWVIALVAFALIFVYATHDIENFNNVIFQILTIVGFNLLTFKVIDGWAWLFVANLFYWDESIYITACLIVLGSMVYAFGFYNWRKEITTMT